MEVAHKDRIEPEDFGLRGDEAQKARYYADFRVEEWRRQFTEALARACAAVEISDSNFESLCIELDRTLNAALTGAEGVRVEGTVMRKEGEC